MLLIQVEFENSIQTLIHDLFFQQMAAAAASDNSKSDHSNLTNQPFNQPPPQSDNPVASTAGSCHKLDSEHPGEGKLIDHGLGNVQHLSGQGSVHH